MVDPLSLAVDACLGAVADAGLTLEDIDGLSTYPGAVGLGMSEGGPTAIEEALRIHPTWINGGGDLPGPGGSVIAAAHGGGLGALPPRAVLPHGLGVDLRDPRVPRVRREWRGHRPAGLRPAPRVARALRRDVGGQLDRHERQPVPAPLSAPRARCSG